MVNNYTLRNILFFFVNVAITICNPLLKLYVKTKIKYRRAKRFLVQKYTIAVEKAADVYAGIIIFIILWLCIVIDFLSKLREQIKHRIKCL